MNLILKTFSQIFYRISVFSFNVLIAKHWEDINNRKLLFCDIAQQRGFDPLIPSNWYKVDSLLNIKVNIINKYK